MNVARIIDGVVAGIEVADLEWLTANASSEIQYVPIPDDLVVNVGSSWSSENGFEDAWNEGSVVETGIIIGERTDGLDDEIGAILAGE